MISARENGEEFLNTHLGRAIESYIVSARADEITLPQVISDYTKKAENTNLSDKQKDRYSKIIASLKHFQETDNYNLLSYIEKRMELLEHFSPSG